MRLMRSILRTTYSLLYHSFAWSYDSVAALVSLGHWRQWIRCSLPYLSGRVLELGFGPGHLQVDLAAQGLSAFGLDESPQMAVQAQRRLLKKSLHPALTRGYAQHLPFRSAAFNCVVATFPSNYIYEEPTLHEIQRVLAPGGSLVIVPMAWITAGLLGRAMAWLMRQVGETSAVAGQLPSPVREILNRAGFIVESRLVELKTSKVLVCVGKKAANSESLRP
jgi:ubiquinone/menaquinone biosynthesis C-methylase UbiE